jgi:predicted O-methyltransferase YrrM
MPEGTWAAVDDYFTSLILQPDTVLDNALQASVKASLPAINVTPTQGKLLHLLARIHHARTILEIGTLGGYSTIWLARALPSDGELVTLELEPKNAEVALSNITQAGLDHIVEIRIGRAVETLVKLETEGHGPFDMIFIDADKPSNPEYFAWALKFSRPGSVIIIDNVVRDGKVADPNSEDPSVRGVQRVMEIISAEPRVSCTAIQTVGGKGYDGFAIALVLS